jgi:hypothetical protein
VVVLDSSSSSVRILSINYITHQPVCFLICKQVGLVVCVDFFILIGLEERDECIVCVVCMANRWWDCWHDERHRSWNLFVASVCGTEGWLHSQVFCSRHDEAEMAIVATSKSGRERMRVSVELFLELANGHGRWVRVTVNLGECLVR